MKPIQYLPAAQSCTVRNLVCFSKSTRLIAEDAIRIQTERSMIVCV
jgi:hypothetical protein